MKSLFTLASAALLAASAVAADWHVVYFDLSHPYFNAMPASNRVVTIQPLTPYPGNLISFTATNGTFRTTNSYIPNGLYNGNYAGVITAKGNAYAIPFYFHLNATNGATVNATEVTTVPVQQSYTYTVAAQNQAFLRTNIDRYLVAGSGMTFTTNANGTLTLAAAAGGASVAAGTNIVAVTNGGVVTLHNPVGTNVVEAIAARVTNNLSSAYLPLTGGTLSGALTLDNGSEPSPSLKFYREPDDNFGIAVAASELKFYKNLDEGGAEIASLTADGLFTADAGFSGNGSGLTDLQIAGIDATGTPDATTFLRGDGTWSPAYNGVKGADVASAGTINLDAATGDLVDVTGTTTITAITLAEGRERTVRFTGALTLTHGASLVLPGGVNRTTVAGDFAIFRGYSGGVVRCVNYSPITVTGTGSTVLSASPTFTGAVTVPAGNATTPGILVGSTSGFSHANNGLYFFGHNPASPSMWLRQGARFGLTSDLDISWSSGSGTPENGHDTGLARNAAGVVEVNSGTSGTLRDLTLRDILITGAEITTKATVSLTADNQVVTVANRSYISLSSDNATAANRTFMLVNGTSGQILRLEWTGTNQGELVDDSANSGSGNIRLSTNWPPAGTEQYDTLTLIFNGTDWIETARSAN